MSPIRTLIVDDVPLARERLRRYLAEEPDIEIVGEAANGAEALRLIASLAPQLAFLDMGLPDFDGLEIARRLPPGADPVVIYLTAHDDRALGAFEAGALDYLTKPFKPERFQRALNRARDQIRLRAGEAAAKTPYLERLAVRDGGRTEIVAVADIDYIDVAGHYLCVHVGKTVHLVRDALSDLEARLDPAEFARIHRSAIVRLSRVRSLEARRNGDADVILVDGSKLLLSRTHAEGLRRKLRLDEM
jgi:two-component system LytT family response regulator